MKSTIEINGDKYFLEMVSASIGVYFNGDNGYAAIVSLNGDVLCVLSAYCNQNFAFLEIVK